MTVQIGSKINRPEHSGTILRLAREQHGVVARHQLLRFGLSSAMIARRIEALILLPVFPGVYAVGSDALSQHGRWMAGVLAGGPGTVLSHRSAGALWGVIDAGPRIELSRSFGIRPKTGLAPGCRIPGLRIRRTRSLPAQETTTFTGIPVMSLERTLLSLASVLTSRQLESAYLATRRSAGFDPVALSSVLSRGPGWKGIGRLRALAVDDSAVELRSKSELEDAFLLLCHRASIPKPGVNAIVEGFEVDCSWPGRRLIVELDSFKHHSDRFSFERDRERDVHLAERGYQVLRFTHRNVLFQPGKTVEKLSRLFRTDAPQ